jgi:hypothetical protein
VRRIGDRYRPAAIGDDRVKSGSGPLAGPPRKEPTPVDGGRFPARPVSALWRVSHLARRTWTAPRPGPFFWGLLLGLPLTGRTLTAPSKIFLALSGQNRLQEGCRQGRKRPWIRSSLFWQSPLRRLSGCGRDATITATVCAPTFLLASPRGKWLRLRGGRKSEKCAITIEEGLRLGDQTCKVTKPPISFGVPASFLD